MHFEHKAGDKLFIDFTGKKLTIVDEHTGEFSRVRDYCMCFRQWSIYLCRKLSKSKDSRFHSLYRKCLMVLLLDKNFKRGKLC